jgi:hypothetical protein
MRLEAYDTFYPFNKGFSNVRINVIRNPSAPRFSLPSYEVTINENFPLGNVAVDVTASDPDNVSRPTRFYFNFILILILHTGMILKNARYF